ncbi:hypothetical protein SESBI_42848 [Sesbania bispinosa]|nr:hypothetical protein SESBI_42848 [Sesbania bispinosa]
MATMARRQSVSAWGRRGTVVAEATARQRCGRTVADRRKRNAFGAFGRNEGGRPEAKRCTQRHHRGGCRNVRARWCDKERAVCARKEMPCNTPPLNCGPTVGDQEFIERVLIYSAFSLSEVDYSY